MQSWIIAHKFQIVLDARKEGKCLPTLRLMDLMIVHWMKMSCMTDLKYAEMYARVAMELGVRTVTSS